MRRWRVLAFLTNISCRLSGCIPPRSIHLLSSSSSWNTSTSENISETTAMPRSFGWCVFHPPLQLRAVVLVSRHQLLGIARAVKDMHNLNIVHGNLEIVRTFLSLHFGHSRSSRKTSSLTPMDASVLPVLEQFIFHPPCRGWTSIGATTALFPSLLTLNAPDPLVPHVRWLTISMRSGSLRGR